MKIFIHFQSLAIASLALFISLTSVNAAQDSTVQLLVRQIQEGPTAHIKGLSADKYFQNIDLLAGNQLKEGEFTALIPVGPYGSTFYLYIQSLDPNEPPYLLATKFIAAYETPIATADFKIISEDEYVPIRTRSDKPFTVEINTFNQKWTDDLTAGTTPVITWNPYTVRVTPSYKVLNDVNTVTEIKNLDPVFLNAENIGENNFSTTRLTVIPSPGRGQETFIIEGVSQKDLMGNDIYKPIDAGTIHIWPTAEGAFDGIQSGQTFTKSMPNVTAELWNLYPKSTSYVEIYKLNDQNKDGVQNSGEKYELYVKPKVAVPPALEFTADVPQGTKLKPRQIILTNWDSEIQHNGTYALKVFTITPFNNGAPELITEVTGLLVDRKVVIKSSIINAESGE